VDFVFNLGAGNFQSSTLLKLLNSGDYQGASGQFPLWNHAGGVVVAGLTARRLAEQTLFNTPIAIPTPPSQTGSGTAPTLVQQLQSWVQALQGKFSGK
jgi:lysozyme